MKKVLFCFAVLACVLANASVPGKQKFGKIKDETLIVTNGYTRAEIDAMVANVGVSTNEVCAIVTNDVAGAWTVGRDYTDGNSAFLTNTAVRWNSGRWEVRVEGVYSVGGGEPSVVDGWFVGAEYNPEYWAPYMITNTDPNATIVTTLKGDFDGNVSEAIYADRTAPRNAIGLAYERDIVPTVTQTVTKAYVEDLGIESGSSFDVGYGLVQVVATNVYKWTFGSVNRYAPYTTNVWTSENKIYSDRECKNEVPYAYISGGFGGYGWYLTETPYPCDISDMHTMIDPVREEIRAEIYVNTNAVVTAEAFTQAKAVIESSISNAVHYTAESKTDAQMAQARTNIQAAAALTQNYYRRYATDTYTGNTIYYVEVVTPSSSSTQIVSAKVMVDGVEKTQNVGYDSGEERFYITWDGGQMGSKRVTVPLYNSNGGGIRWYVNPYPLNDDISFISTVTAESVPFARYDSVANATKLNDKTEAQLSTEILNSAKTYMSANYVPTSRKINDNPLTANITLDAGDVGAYSTSEADAAFYPKASGEAWSTYWDGDEVRVTITNYYGMADIPHLYMEQRTNETGTAQYKIVWDEVTRWNKFLGADWSWTGWAGAYAFKTNVLAQIADINANKADRSWGFYDSYTGEYAPDGYTQVSSSNVIIAAGMGYQRRITTSGDTYWVLTANEPFVYNGTTNGAFQVKDSDGNVQIEIVKGDKRTVGARCGGVSVSGRTLIANYAVVASQHPTLEVCADLANPVWKSEDASDCPATVSWTGSSGAYVASVTPKSASATSVFVRASYQAGGETYVRHACPVGMSQIMLNNTLYNLGTATINGHTVLTLTAQ